MKKLLRWFPVAWAGGAYLAFLAVPMYGVASVSQTSTGVDLRAAGRATLAAVNGSEVYLILAIPVVAAVLSALPWPVRLQRAANIVGATIASAFVVLGMASVGLFYLPCALALVVRAQRPS